MERNLNSILGASDPKKKSLPTCALSVSSLAAGWGWPGPKEMCLLVLWHSPSSLHAKQVCEVRVSRHLFVLDMYGIKRSLGGEFSFCCLKISILADFIRLVAEWSGNENSLAVFEERTGGSGLERSRVCSYPCVWRAGIPATSHHSEDISSSTTSSSLAFQEFTPAKAGEITLLIPRINCAVLHGLQYVLMTSGQVGNFVLNGTANAMKDYLAPKSPSWGSTRATPGTNTGWKDWEQIWGEGPLLWRTGWDIWVCSAWKREASGETSEQFPSS